MTISNLRGKIYCFTIEEKKFLTFLNGKKKKTFLVLGKRKKSHVTRSGSMIGVTRWCFFFDFTTIALQPQIYPMEHYHKEA